MEELLVQGKKRAGGLAGEVQYLCRDLHTLHVNQLPGYDWSSAPAHSRTVSIHLIFSKTTVFFVGKSVPVPQEIK